MDKNLNDNLKSLTIGTFAKISGVSVETIRFYQRKKLLNEPVKPYGGIRKYDLTDVKRVKFIKSAQGLGFSLDEIASLLALEDGSHCCAEVRSLAQNKLLDVRAKIDELSRLERVLDELTITCTLTEDTSISCPIISNLYKD
ncbi:MAG: MerR family transcriptional regulator, mercuric resistance operon regulatory protein [Thiomicrorhabdus sp.]|nr:MAG: MerR family transcriptional regulator, mercuric resistance operon regulatory protein [Thiomicrorhabdus sp.]